VSRAVRFERRQQHTAHRGAIGRQPRADAQAHRHDAFGRRPGDIDDLVAFEDRGGAGCVVLLAEMLQKRLEKLRQRRRQQIGVAEPENPRRKREQLAVIMRVAKLVQGQEAASRGGARQACFDGDIGAGQAFMLVVEAFDDGKALLQSENEVSIRALPGCFLHRFHPKAILYFFWRVGAHSIAKRDRISKKRCS
jgi:hypothetical protein